MAENKMEPKKVSMSSTKQEMLNAYNALLKQLQEKDETELKPEKRIEEKKMNKSGRAYGQMWSVPLKD